LQKRAASPRKVIDEPDSLGEISQQTKKSVEKAAHEALLYYNITVRIGDSSAIFLEGSLPS
jgi:hypothetical protein